ncbi:hypothetical protein Ddye_012140 [Dipteronia dyeriana]|uniref:Uncharacterized protein n=1 Tax=Dipteronia dyeriana TaxID=168575 RepID=A0AAE0CI89_9ROSI|nr:hypothetical protein Ddye_012140 [Dipteronia dyeriana]
MREIDLVSIKAQAWLAEIETETWCRHAFDPSIKCDHVTNNMIEAFNNMLKCFRARTYLNLMEFVRRMVLTRFQLRKMDCGKWKSEIPPIVNKKIVENNVDSRILKLLHLREGKYDLMGLNRAYTAILQEKTYECGSWQISWVSCSHALAVIRHFYGMTGIKKGLTQFIHPRLSKSTFLRTYSFMISLIPDSCVWVNMEVAHIDPPPIKKKPDRPKLVRNRESHEKPKASRSGSVVCTRCKNPGHNKRTCKFVITSEKGYKGCEKLSNPIIEVVASSSQPPT